MVVQVLWIVDAWCDRRVSGADRQYPTKVRWMVAGGNRPPATNPNDLPHRSAGGTLG